MLPKRTRLRSRLLPRPAVAQRRHARAMRHRTTCRANCDTCRRIAIARLARVQLAAYRRRAVNETPQTDASSTVKVPPRTLRVVVAEDEPDSLRTLVELLRSEGHITEGAGTSKEFWRLFHTIGPNVCLVDIGLPDRSGYEIAQEMARRYGRDPPKLVAVPGRIQAS